jgi:hypothetical protein
MKATAYPLATRREHGEWIGSAATASSAVAVFKRWQRLRLPPSHPAKHIRILGAVLAKVRWETGISETAWIPLTAIPVTKKAKRPAFETGLAA